MAMSEKQTLSLVKYSYGPASGPVQSSLIHIYDSSLCLTIERAWSYTNLNVVKGVQTIVCFLF